MELPQRKNWKEEEVNKQENLKGGGSYLQRSLGPFIPCLDVKEKCKLLCFFIVNYFDILQSFKRRPVTILHDIFVG